MFKFLKNWFSRTEKSEIKETPKIEPKMATSKTPRRYDRLAEEGYRSNVIAFRSINLVARAIASVPLVLHKGDERLTEHPLLSLLAKPNPMQQGTGLLYNLAGYYLIAGNAYMLAVGPEDGAPQELWLMRPDGVEVVAGSDGCPSGFKQRVGSKSRLYPAESMLHWKSFNPLNDWYGMAPLEVCRDAIDSYNQSSVNLDDLKEQLTEKYTGADNAGHPVLLEGGLIWQDMGETVHKAGKNMSAREIAIAFGVAPQLVGIPDSQTYSNMAEARLGLWEDTVSPLVNDLVEQLNHWLVPRFEDGKDLKLTADFSSLPISNIKTPKEKYND